MLPVPPAITGGFIALDLIWSTYRFYAAGIAALVIVLIWLFIEKTPYGAIIKAGAHDSEMVRALGINLAKLRIAVFVLGTMLAAVAGIILAPIWGIRPHMGVDAVVPAFLVIVLGGVGSFWGAVIGRAAGRHGGRPHRRLRVGMVAALDVPPAGRGRDLPRARPVRQEEHPGGLMRMHDACAMPTQLVTPAMLVRRARASRRCRCGSRRSASTPISASRS